jgi:hypothetical protein
MASENLDWGYDRIAGALADLGYEISDQTVGNVLQRHGLPPALSVQFFDHTGSASFEFPTCPFLRKSEACRGGSRGSQQGVEPASMNVRRFDLPAGLWVAADSTHAAPPFSATERTVLPL